jgi:hypothetical protein
MLLLACREGRFVDKTSGGFVDMPALRAVISEQDSRFQYPPGAYNENSTISIVEKQNAAKIWVWSGNRKELVVITEGQSVTLGTVGGTLAVASITDGKAAIEHNGVPLPLLGQREETNADGTWIFVTDLFLNAP